jgi:H+-transporting ATPase
VLIASVLATYGIGVTLLPIAVIGETLIAAALFAFIVDFAKVPVFSRLQIV